MVVARKQCSSKSLVDSLGNSVSCSAWECEVTSDLQIVESMMSGMQVPVSDVRLFWGGSPMTEEQIGGLRGTVFFYSSGSSSNRTPSKSTTSRGDPVK